MRFNLAFLLLLAGTGLGNVVQEKRDTASLNMASVLSQASVLSAKFSATTTNVLPFITPGGNLMQPPASLIGAIITAVPMSVLQELAQPALRSSIASQFRAGNTPAWYQTLPADVKSYIESLETQIAGGGVDLSATPSAFSFPAETGATQKTGTGAVAAAASSTSKAIAPQGTGAVGLSLAAAVGMLGIVIIL